MGSPCKFLTFFVVIAVVFGMRSGMTVTSTSPSDVPETIHGRGDNHQATEESTPRKQDQNQELTEEQVSGCQPPDAKQCNNKLVLSPCPSHRLRSLIALLWPSLTISVL